MRISTYTELKNNLTKTMDSVLEDHVPVIITRGSKEPVVMISFADFNACEETMYLLKDSNNRQRLLKSVENIEKRNYKKRKLK
ncbi:MAG TPA: type II toxin-antitoxin system prevent-host-death family antitoxin [Rickettsiales bacterium]|nr:type II toxin-antitoxin system prevent-host-death family antitoxin [Rickettsiales bacterium]